MIFSSQPTSEASMILVMCANAGVDRTYEVEGFAAGGLHHPQRVHVSAGGKGLNVARALAGLGLTSVVTGFLGGFSGDFLYCDLDRLGVFGEFSRIREESRTTISVVDTQSHQVTRLDEWGPTVSETETELLGERWEELLPFARMAVISGNPPPSVPPEFYRRLVETAHTFAVPVVLDAHEEYLREGLAASPEVITPNLAELCWIAEHPLSVPEEVVECSRDLIAHGAQTVFTTLDARGAILVPRDAQALQVTPPAVDVVSTVGAGDCAVAGWVAAQWWGLSLVEQARWAVAAGAVGCTHPGAGELTRDEIEAFLPETRISDLS